MMRPLDDAALLALWERGRAGSPAARSLLGRYFDAQLTLEARENARFRIEIPVK